MKHGSLFTGIGGFDLAAEWMGWDNVFQCEIDEFCLKVLNKNFPNVKKYTDIKKFNAKEYNGTIDIISGGFPCQPFSTAGLQKNEDDERFLWNEMQRIINEVQPKWVVCENVTGLLSIDNSRTIQRIYNDLEGEGYRIEIFTIPAFGVGALHKRERVWIVANSDSSGLLKSDNVCEQQGRTDVLWTSKIGKTVCWEELENRSRDTNKGRIEKPISEPYVCGRNNGIPDRMDRIKGLGNAIVPQVAFEFFKSIAVVNCG